MATQNRYVFFLEFNVLFWETTHSKNNCRFLLCFKITFLTTFSFMKIKLIQFHSVLTWITEYRFFFLNNYLHKNNIYERIFPFQLVGLPPLRLTPVKIHIPILYIPSCPIPVVQCVGVAYDLEFRVERIKEIRGVEP